MRFSYSILFLGLWLTGQCWVPGEAYPKPSISVHPNGTVALGGTVSIRCKNEDPNKWVPEGIQTEFYLQKEMASDFKMLRDEVAEHDEVVFLIVNATLSDAGIYRCLYCYKSYNCLLWSHYSDIVNISIRGQVRDKSSFSMNVSENTTNNGNPSAIIWAGAAAGSLGLVLLMLLLLFVLYKRRKRGSTAHRRMQPLPMKESNLSLKREEESEAEDDPDGVSYAVLNHQSLKRQEQAKPDSIPESCVYASVANDSTRKDR